uniref:Uncharacterized protein n=1 Tax=Oryza glumipatula TaxID=40148 RepID=A0A0E0B8Z7_9ORYZ
MEGRRAPMMMALSRWWWWRRRRSRRRRRVGDDNDDAGGAGGGWRPPAGAAMASAGGASGGAALGRAGSAAIGSVAFAAASPPALAALAAEPANTLSPYAARLRPARPPFGRRPSPVPVVPAPSPAAARTAGRRAHSRVAASRRADAASAPPALLGSAPPVLSEVVVILCSKSHLQNPSLCTRSLYTTILPPISQISTAAPPRMAAAASAIPCSPGLGRASPGPQIQSGRAAERVVDWFLVPFPGSHPLCSLHSSSTLLPIPSVRSSPPTPNATCNGSRFTRSARPRWSPRTCMICAADLPATVGAICSVLPCARQPVTTNLNPRRAFACSAFFLLKNCRLLSSQFHCRRSKNIQLSCDNCNQVTVLRSIIYSDFLDITVRNIRKNMKNFGLDYKRRFLRCSFLYIKTIHVPC